ncbi:unnamed protein product [Adineta ricciae]|uniref:Uncharacterized protein n=1 Tax=Adineta ricciae TaxID=249248 RepID=A0A816CI82_ADIRI|nr:unnamed protein product [Adineta ricciae]
MMKLNFIRNGFVCMTAAIEYLFSGILFGVIPRITYENPKEFSCLIMKGSPLFSMLYFTSITIVDMYYGYYDGFILPMTMLAFLTLTGLLVALAKLDKNALTNDSYRLLFIVLEGILLIK